MLLVADPAERVARRHAELGERIDADAVTDRVIRRDSDDSTVAQFTLPHLVSLFDSARAGHRRDLRTCPGAARVGSTPPIGRGWGGHGTVIAGVSPDLPHMPHICR